MAFAADRAVTLTHYEYDPATDSDMTQTFLLAGVSWHAVTSINTGAGGASSANLYRLRIFSDHSTAGGQLIRLSGEVLRVLDKEVYVIPLSETEQVSISVGDKVQCGADTATITSIHDNRGQRMAPHWYVEAR